MDRNRNWDDKQMDEWIGVLGTSRNLPMKFDRTTDKLQFAGQKNSRPGEWNAALDFLAKSDLLSMDTGRYELSGGAYATVSDYLSRDEGDFESHRKFIDIQYIASGREYIDIAPMDSITEITGEYDPERDIMFFKTDSYQRRLADRGILFVFFPSDAHRPCMKVDDNEPVRKIVVKIPFAEI